MIRKFTTDDTASIMDIWLETNIRAHDFIPCSYWKNNCGTVAEMLPASELYVYEECGKIEGFIGLSGNYIEGIFVRAGSQSKGIGKALLDKAKRIKNNLTLNVYEKNIRAANFYKREGFTIRASGTDENTGENELSMFWENR